MPKKRATPEQIVTLLRPNQRPRKTLGFETPADRLGLVLQ
jgi:IS30 family transposase